MIDLLGNIIKGGYMMIPLMACSVVALAVVMDRGIAFWKYNSVDTRLLRAQVRELLRQRKISDAALLCSQTPGPVAAVMLIGIQAYERYVGFHKTR
jgi:biopolymer transport protein ExbB